MTICASRSVSGLPILVLVALPLAVPSVLVFLGWHRKQWIIAAFKQSQDLHFSFLSSTTNHRNSNENNSNTGSITNRMYVDEQPCSGIRDGYNNSENDSNSKAYNRTAISIHSCHRRRVILLVRPTAITASSGTPDGHKETTTLALTTTQMLRQ